MIVDSDSFAYYSVVLHSKAFRHIRLCTRCDRILRHYKLTVDLDLANCSRDCGFYEMRLFLPLFNVSSNEIIMYCQHRCGNYIGCSY